MFSTCFSTCASHVNSVLQTPTFIKRIKRKYHKSRGWRKMKNLLSWKWPQTFRPHHLCYIKCQYCIFLSWQSAQCCRFTCSQLKNTCSRFLFTQWGHLSSTENTLFVALSVKWLYYVYNLKLVTFSNDRLSK